MHNVILQQKGVEVPLKYDFQFLHLSNAKNYLKYKNKIIVEEIVK